MNELAGRITDINQIVGKTIKAIYLDASDQDCVLRFTDDSWLWIHAMISWEDAEIDLKYKPDRYELVDAGLMTKEECARLDEEYKESFKREQIEIRRKQYERLRQEFDGKGST